MRNRVPTSFAYLFLLAFASPLQAQSNSVQYLFDALGRLTQVIDPSGNLATYNYDAVGNLLSITTSTTSPSALAIFSFAPTQGSAGQTVTIQGQNFSATPSSDTVKFNGTTAVVTAATTNQLTTTVPAGADAGIGGLAGYTPGHGLLLGFYGEVEGWAGNRGAFGGYGSGAYILVTTAANCVN